MLTDEKESGLSFITSLNENKIKIFVEMHFSIADFLYQEAFLTTYRTFLSPLELIKKLNRRHQRFSCSVDVVKQRAAREAFSLLVRVVSDLT